LHALLFLYFLQHFFFVAMRTPGAGMKMKVVFRNTKGVYRSLATASTGETRRAGRRRDGG
jgi:hypothetical protein